jgi:hypothetical protein
MIGIHPIRIFRLSFPAKICLVPCLRIESSKDFQRSRRGYSLSATIDPQFSIDIGNVSFNGTNRDD